MSNHPLAKDIFMTVFDKSYAGMDEERKSEIYASLMWQCLSERDMGWAMTGIGELIDGFEKLDKEHPYDNGYSYADVTDIEIIEASEEAIQVKLI